MLTAYLKRQWKLLLLLAGAVAVFAAVFALYSLPVEAVAYAGLLCLMLGLVLFALGYSAFLRRHRELEGLLRKVHESVLPLPPPRGVLEADYQALLRAVCADRVCWNTGGKQIPSGFLSRRTSSCMKAGC